MPNTIAVLDFDLPDGRLGELEVFDNDTVESISEILKGHGIDPSSHLEQIQQVVNGGFGSDLVDSDSKDPFAQDKIKLGAIDNEIKALQNQLKNAASKKEADLIVKKLNSKRKDRKKFEGIEITAKNRGIIEAIKPQLARLKDIETTSDPLSLLNYGIQKAGGFLNLNPELTAFEQAQEGLKIPVLRNLLGEKGATQQQEQEAAKKIFFPSGPGLFSKNTRPELLDNVFNTVLGITGINLKDELGDEFLKDIGARVEGEVGGPSISFMEGLGKIFGSEEKPKTPVSADRQERINRIRQRSR